jgi:hypothetical protein
MGILRASPHCSILFLVYFLLFNVYLLNSDLRRVRIHAAGVLLIRSTASF